MELQLTKPEALEKKIKINGVIQLNQVVHTRISHHLLLWYIRAVTKRKVKLVLNSVGMLKHFFQLHYSEVTTPSQFWSF